MKVLSKADYFAQTEYEPHEGQAAIHYDPSRHRVLCNGRRWGKSLMGGKEAEPTCFVTNRYGQAQTGWIVGPNYSDCEKEFRVIYDSLKRLGVDMVSTKFLNNPDSGNMHIKTQWGWDLQCRSAAHPETLTGEGLDFVLMVEAGRQKRKTWTEYIRPALSDKKGWSLHSGVPEGPSPTSLLYALWQRGLSERYPTWKSWRMPSWTNTVMFPGGEFDPEIEEARADLTDEEFRRQYGAEFVERVGRVMKEWDDEIHLADLDFDARYPLYAAVDYGFTNPFVWLWIQVDVFDNITVLGEHYITGKDTSEIAQELKDHPWMPHLVRFFPDPAEPDDTNTLARILKKPFSSNTGGPIKTRLEIIRSKLKTYPPEAPIEKQTPWMRIDRRCTQLAWEMREGYRWPEHRSEVKNDSENPLDKNNHGPEALGRFMKGYYGAPEGRQHARIKKARIRA